MTVIQECKNPICESKFQDEMYGKGRRVHNTLGKNDKNHGREIQRTVCLAKRENKNRKESKSTKQ